MSSYNGLSLLNTTHAWLTGLSAGSVAGVTRRLCGRWGDKGGRQGNGEYAKPPSGARLHGTKEMRADTAAHLLLHTTRVGVR